MAKDEKCVEYYSVGTLNAPVPFYDGYTDCRHCPKCQYDKYFGLYRCKLSDEFPMLGLQFTIAANELDKRHDNCPLEFSPLPF